MLDTLNLNSNFSISSMYIIFMIWLILNSLYDCEMVSENALNVNIRLFQYK